MTMSTLGWLCQTLHADAPDLPSDTPLGPISIDTRTIKPGDTFWVLQSTRDGHDFVPEAFKKGAKAAIVNSLWKNAAQTRRFHDQLIGLSDTMQGLTDAAQAWRTQCGFDVLGITGSNGKTSTKDIILRLLSRNVRTAGTQGNLNNQFGVPLTLLGLPSDLEVAVIEMGASHEGEIAELCEICRPTHGLVTSISSAHLEGFHNIETVARTKGELYDFIAAEGVAFVPTEDERCRKEAALCMNKIGYGFSVPPADWSTVYCQGSDVMFDETGCAHFTFENVRFSLSVPGRAPALTALAGLTVAKVFGIPAIECQSTIRDWPGVPGRFEMLRRGKVLIINDSYNANPASMRAALETLAQINIEPRIAVLGDMNELGTESDHEHRALGRDLGKYGLKQAILVGRQARLIAETAREVGITVHWHENFEQLAAELPDLVPKMGAILVKASRSSRLERVVEYLTKAIS